MGKKFHGFSLVELLVAVAIILVLAGGIILNINSMKTTPKKEAEKVAHFLMTEINKADKRHRGVLFDFTQNKIQAKKADSESESDIWGEIKASSGCTYSTSKSKLDYNMPLDDSTMKHIKGRNWTIKTSNTSVNASNSFNVTINGKDAGGSNVSYYAIITVSGDTTIE